MRVVEVLFLLLVFYVRKPSFLTMGIWLTAAVAAFFCMAWNLHLIVEAEGERRVLRLTLPSGAFSAFLWVVVVVHIVLIGLEVTGLSWLFDGTRKTWAFWILVVFLVAWVAGREPEEGSLSLA